LGESSFSVQPLLNVENPAAPRISAPSADSAYRITNPSKIARFLEVSSCATGASNANFTLLDRRTGAKVVLPAANPSVNVGDADWSTHQFGHWLSTQVRVRLESGDLNSQAVLDEISREVVLTDVTKRLCYQACAVHQLCLGRWEQAIETVKLFEFDLQILAQDSKWTGLSAVIRVARTLSIWDLRYFAQDIHGILVRFIRMELDVSSFEQIFRVFCKSLLRVRPTSILPALLEAECDLAATRGYGTPSINFFRGVAYALRGRRDHAEQYFSRSLGEWENVDFDLQGAATYRAFRNFRPGYSEEPNVGLSPIEWGAKLSAKAPFVIMFACDSNYFTKYGLQYLYSIDRLGSPAATHVHIVNPTAEICIILPYIRTLMRSIDLGYSFEVKIGAESSYLKSARFLRAAELMDVYQRPLLVTDADSLCASDPMKATGYNEADFVGRFIPDNVLPWHVYPAGLTMVFPTFRGRRILSSICSSIIDIMGTEGWEDQRSIDQNSLYASLSYFRSAVPDSRLRFDIDFGIHRYVRFGYLGRPDFEEVFKKVTESFVRRCSAHSPICFTD
jgi:hypothetical protein